MATQSLNIHRRSWARHLIAQALLVLFFVYNVPMVIALNRVLDFVGVDPHDSHVTLGVYVYAVLALIVPPLYLVASERLPGMRLSINPWALRVEVTLLMAAGITYFVM